MRPSTLGRGGGMSVDRERLENLLREFEDTWAEHEGRRLTSAEFYDQYRRGEFDTQFGIAWASYYEILQRVRRPDIPVEVIA
jgi:hypothetical protein